MKLFKLIFAAHMAVVAVFLLLIILGPFVFGFERIDKIIGKYGMAIYLVVFLVTFPLARKYLK